MNSVSVSRGVHLRGGGVPVLLCASVVWLLLAGGREARAFVLPAGRVVTWQGNVGVKGGIPNRTTIRNCVTSDGVRAGGVDTAAAIRTCLANTPAGGVAYLPAGTYIVNSTVSVPSGKTLRGAGDRATVIRADATVTQILAIVGPYTDCTASPGVAIVSGFTKGSTSLQLADASAFVVGGHAFLSELNDATIPVTSSENGVWKSGCYGTNGLRNRSQIVAVVGKSGNTLTIDPPLFFTFSSGNSPTAKKTGTYTQDAGIEDLTVKIGTGTGTLRNIFLQGTANCWVKNVRIENCGKRCITFNIDNFRDELRDSYMTGCVDQFNSDTCYGVEINASSSNLIENNVFHNTANGPVLVGSSGNVIGHNYHYGVHRTQNLSTWFWHDSWTHGSHCSYNLWEGNVASGLQWDYYWGSNSHNTAFRNRYYGRDATVAYGAYHQDAAAISTAKNNHYVNIVGNVLGSDGFSNTYEVRNVDGWTSNAIYSTGMAGGDNAAFTTMLRHRNYDYVTKRTASCSDAGEPGCQGAGSDTVLPPSLYLAAKPAWWGSGQWPAIGPDVPALESSTPARLLFLKPAIRVAP